MRLRTLLAAGCVMATLAGCKDQELRSEVDAWAHNVIHPWNERVYASICEIESKVAGLDPTKQLCPGGPGDITTPKAPPDFDD